MRRARLGTLLIGLNTGLVLLAVACLSVAAVRLLDRFADEQALARVSLAGTSALQAIERSGGDVLTTLRLDKGFRDRISRQVGLPVSIVLREQAEAEVDDPREPLRERVLTDGTPALERVDAAGVYLHVLPL